MSEGLTDPRSLHAARYAAASYIPLKRYRLTDNLSTALQHSESLSEILHAFLLSLMCAMCLDHPILLDVDDASDIWHRLHITKLPINPYPTAFPYGNGMVLHFYQQQESSTTKTVHKVINKGLKAYV